MLCPHEDSDRSAFLNHTGRKAGRGDSAIAHKASEVFPWLEQAMVAAIGAAAA